MGLLDWILGAKKRRDPSSLIATGQILTQTTMTGVAYVEWSALDDACPRCKNAAQWVWAPEVKMQEPPLASCCHTGGCRCMCFYAFEDMQGAQEEAAFIRSRGGRCRVSELDEWREEKAAPLRRARDLQRTGSELADEARNAERAKDYLRAAAHYRDAIEAHRNAAELVAEDPWRYSDLPYLYNRLSLTLERAGEYGQAFATVEEYESLQIEAVPKAEAEAMAKRKARLRTRLDK